MKIKRKLLAQLIAGAKDKSPREICGVLSGATGRAEKIYFFENISASPDKCYEVNPTEQLSVFKKIRSAGEEVVAIFHSHTGTKAYPSKRDVELAFYPDSEYLIISLENPDAPEARTFSILDGKIAEQEMILVEELYEGK